LGGIQNGFGGTQGEADFVGQKPTPNKLGAYRRPDENVDIVASPVRPPRFRNGAITPSSGHEILR
jgi:hypothetical protein